MATADFFSLPMDARPGRDPIIGYDEAGNPLYRGLLGNSYTVKPQAAPDPQRAIAGQLAQGLLGNPFYGPAQAEMDVQRQGAEATLGGILPGLLQGVMQGVEAPGRAARGEPVTYGDVWATALDYGALAAPAGKPAGALGGGGIRRQEFDLAPYLGQYEYLGLRTVEEGSDPLRASRVWVNGDPTDQLLDGVSTTDAMHPKAAAMHGLAPPDWNVGKYYGDRTYLMGSDVAERGEDVGELVMRDPVVLAEIVRKYGIAGAAAMLGMSAAELQAQLGGASAAPTESDIRGYLLNVGAN